MHVWYAPLAALYATPMNVSERGPISCRGKKALCRKESGR
jgi:hypothetical protein